MQESGRGSTEVAEGCDLGPVPSVCPDTSDVHIQPVLLYLLLPLSFLSCLPDAAESQERGALTTLGDSRGRTRLRERSSHVALSSHAAAGRTTASAASGAALQLPGHLARGTGPAASWECSQSLSGGGRHSDPSGI